jgi:hypothetical protein
VGVPSSPVAASGEISSATTGQVIASIGATDAWPTVSGTRIAEKASDISFASSSD